MLRFCVFNKFSRSDFSILFPVHARFPDPSCVDENPGRHVQAEMSSLPASDLDPGGHGEQPLSMLFR